MKKTVFFCSLLLSCHAFAKDSFDREMLRDLGYDDSVGDLLAEEAHFLPGHHQVTLIINGQQKGSKDLTFDRQGKACWSSALLEELGITPRAFTSAAESDCLIPAPENNITVIEHPDRNSLELKVPPDWLQDRLHYASGGKALILNYDANVYRYQRQSANSATSQTLTSEAGINFNDWIVRSGQSFSTWGGKKDFSRLYTYTQKTFTNLSSVLQAGEISTNDPVFGGINLTGAQLFPEMALQGGSNHATIDTVIPLAATVEVWQRDILLKSFRLPAGAVTLEDIPVLNRQDDFILKIRDDAGGEQQQIIPYIQARTARVFSPTGLSLAAGQLRLSSEKFPLATASAGVYQNTRLSLVSGGLVSQDYQSAAWRADIRLTETLLSTLTQTLSLAKDSQEQSGHVKGIKNQASLAYPVTGSLSANAVASFYSQNFLEPGSAMTYRRTVAETGQIKTQYSTGLSYSHPVLGSLSLSGTVTHNYRSSDVIGYVMNWGKSIGRTNINVGLQKNRLTTDGRRYDNRYLYLNLSIPLGENLSLRSWASNTHNQSRYGVGFDQTVNEKLTWNMNSEKSSQRDPSVSAAATWTSKYSKLNGSVSKGDSNSYSLGARGGAVVHSEGLTFTPRQVSDTFGIISLNSNQADVEITTPRGKVWTDRQGYAIASWTPWQKNTVQINTRSLKKNVQVQSGIAEVTPYRGAVLPISLPAHEVRRALVSFVPGVQLAPGSPVKNDQAELIAFVNEDKTIFFDDLPEGALFGQTTTGTRCRIELNSPWQYMPDTLYAALTARCE